MRYIVLVSQFFLLFFHRWKCWWLYFHIYWAYIQIINPTQTHFVKFPKLNETQMKSSKRLWSCVRKYRGERIEPIKNIVCVFFSSHSSFLRHTSYMNFYYVECKIYLNSVFCFVLVSCFILLSYHSTFVTESTRRTPCFFASLLVALENNSVISLLFDENRNVENNMTFASESEKNKMNKKHIFAFVIPESKQTHVYKWKCGEVQLRHFTADPINVSFYCSARWSYLALPHMLIKTNQQLNKLRSAENLSLKLND